MHAHNRNAEKRRGVPLEDMYFLAVGRQQRGTFQSLANTYIHARAGRDSLTNNDANAKNYNPLSPISCLFLSALQGHYPLLLLNEGLLSPCFLSVALQKMQFPLSSVFFPSFFLWALGTERGTSQWHPKLPNLAWPDLTGQNSASVDSRASTE